MELELGPSLLLDASLCHLHVYAHAYTCMPTLGVLTKIWQHRMAPPHLTHACTCLLHGQWTCHACAYTNRMQRSAGPLSRANQASDSVVQRAAASRSAAWHVRTMHVYIGTAGGTCSACVQTYQFLLRPYQRELSNRAHTYGTYACRADLRLERIRLRREAAIERMIASSALVILCACQTV